MPWKTSAPSGGGHAAKRVEKREQIEDAVIDAPAAGEDPRRADEALEHHRRLAFVAGAVADAEEAARGVEPAPASGRCGGSSRASSIARQRRPLRTPAALDISARSPSSRAPRAAMRHGSRAADVSAGEREGSQVPDALEARAVDAEQLAAPGVPVVAEPDTVEREAEMRALPPVLGEDGGDVGVVVLDRRRSGRPSCSRVPRGQEVGVEIVRDGDRRDLEDGPQVDDGLLEEAVASPRRPCRRGAARGTRDRRA